MHALIIEDEALIAMVIEDALRDSGFTSVEVVASAQAAIEAAAHRCPDLITSDVQLRPGCGINAVLSICDGSAIPVIFITGNAEDVTRRLPGHVVLAKPFCTSALAAAVAAAMQ